ncbi:Protein lin-28-like protein A [Bienertia sinuspersici]
MHAGLGAVQWFKDVGPLDRWARWRYDPRLCNDENTNKFVESFNSINRRVRRISMVRHATRQQIVEKWPGHGICLNIKNRLRVLTRDSRVCQAYRSGRGCYEIHDGRAKLPVSISARTCVCGRWRLSGILCKHGIKAILHEGRDPADYVTGWYSASRSSRNRRREKVKQRKGKRSTTVRCGNCNALGHNVATCKGGMTVKEMAQQQGKNVVQKAQTRGKKKQADDNLENQPNLIEMMINEVFNDDVAHETKNDHGA